MKKLLDRGVIERVPIEEPCEWVSPGFFVPKADRKSLRLVTDFSYLNQFMKRPFHLFPSAQEILPSPKFLHSWTLSGAITRFSLTLRAES